jgi:hypothetical protein
VHRTVPTPRGGRLVKCLAIASVVVMLVGVFVAPAAAGRPEKSPDTFTDVSQVAGVCAFPVDVTYTVTAMNTYFFDANGAMTRWQIHATEQDTFSANGKTLAGLPYTYNVQVLYDRNGEVEHWYASGVASRVPLPDGHVFLSAGRVDFINHGDWVLSPDKGNPGDVAAFCAALAP